jgi:hypothetical protein
VVRLISVDGDTSYALAARTQRTDVAAAVCLAP